MSQKGASELLVLENPYIGHQPEQTEQDHGEVKQISKESSFPEATITESCRKNTFIEDLKSATTETHCPEHPEESLQFYCFDTATTLCAECLVKGGYTGKEVVNLRKAAERLKGKLSDLSLETTHKFEACDLLEREVEAREAQIEEISSKQKEEISREMDALRKVINLKEEELMEKINAMREDKLKALKTTSKSLQSFKDEMQEVKDIIEHSLKDLSDLSICNFYLKKRDTIKNHLTEEIDQDIQRLKNALKRYELQDQVHLSKLQEDCQKLRSDFAALGAEVGRNRFEVSPASTEPRERSVKHSVRTTKPSTFSREASLPHGLSLKEESPKQVPSFLNKKTFTEEASSYMSARLLNVKPSVTSDMDKSSLSRNDYIRGSSVKSSNPMIIRYKEQLAKTIESRDIKTSHRTSNLDVTPTRSAISGTSNTASRKGGLESLLGSYSPRITNSRSWLLDSTVDQIKSCRDSTEAKKGSETAKFFTKNSNKGSEISNELDADKSYMSKKVEKKSESVISNDNSLRYRLEKLNHKLFN